MDGGKELNTDLHPLGARLALIDTVNGIFDVCSQTAVALHPELGFIAVAEGDIMPRTKAEIESYGGTHLGLMRYADPLNDRLAVKIWSKDNTIAYRYLLVPAGPEIDALDKTTAYRDRVLDHMCRLITFVPVQAEVTLAKFMHDYDNGSTAE